MDAGDDLCRHGVEEMGRGEVDLNRGDEGFFLVARLEVSLPGLDADVARSLIDRAHEICPYSRMTRSGIKADVTLA